MDTKLRVYHGATQIVDKPEIRYIARPMDFGVGFYVTTYPKQAEGWAAKRAKRENAVPIVNIYELDLFGLKNSLTAKIFEGTSESWLNFILEHRKASAYLRISGNKRLLAAKSGIHHGYDMVMGEVADDSVFDSIENYEAGLITKKELLRSLKAKEVNDQICFCTEESLKFLSFVDSYSKGR